MVTGNVYNVILETAETEKADLVIMGREGTSALQGRFLGNITGRIARKVVCPVMIIPQG